MPYLNFLKGSSTILTIHAPEETSQIEGFGNEPIIEIQFIRPNIDTGFSKRAQPRSSLFRILVIPSVHE